MPAEPTDTGAAPARSARRYQSPRRARQARETRSAILAAAAALFAERGWSRTTLAAVAAQAETAIETIYAGFGSKVGLLEAAIDVAVVGDELPIPLAQRPAYATLGTGPRQQRIAALAKLVTVILNRTAPLMRALRQAATSEPALTERWSAYETARRDEMARSLTFLAGAPPADTLTATTWVVTSGEVYDKLTQELGWSDPQYELWLADVLETLTDRHAPD
jgi:AcrR family transcriptional regulator